MILNQARTLRISLHRVFFLFALHRFSDSFTLNVIIDLAWMKVNVLFMFVNPPVLLTC